MRLQKEAEAIEEIVTQRLIQIKAEEERIKAEEERIKAEAVVEPRINVKQIDFTDNNPRDGAFELDWNKEFVDWLRLAGYPGEKDEQVVDIWFTELCKNVAIETWEQHNADPDHRYINVEDLGDGRKSVS